MILDQRYFGTCDNEIDGSDYDYGIGKWYSFCSKGYIGLTTWVNVKTWLSTSK